MVSIQLSPRGHILEEHWVNLDIVVRRKKHFIVRTESGSLERNQSYLERCLPSNLHSGSELGNNSTQIVSVGREEHKSREAGVINVLYGHPNFMIKIPLNFCDYLINIIFLVFRSPVES